ncbi:MAG: alpha-ribazole phosphatase family protein [Gammaproteobacteria bacterium]|nr:MAG: alpha-ribazole phosphatase family protein [Gammaproteobacteria bacterium]
MRHGEPVGGRRYRGQIDDALSEKGWEQMWNAVDTDPDWQQIVSSPLQRCSAFAASLAESLALPLQVESRFMEVGFGDWEGKTRDELDRLDPGQIGRFYRDPVNNRPPGAEPLEKFTDRVLTAFREILKRFSGQSVLVVAHAGVIRVILAHALDMPFSTMYRINVPNAGISRISTHPERGFRFMSHGDR